MATAFDMSAEEAGDAMAKLSNVYQIPITEMSKLGDAINHLSDNTASKARDIVPALNLIGGTAKQFGLSAQQASSLASAFIALGKAPMKAGTAINAMLSKLQTADKQGAKFQKALEDIGISGEQMTKAIGEDAQGALLQFFRAFEKIDKQDRAGILFDLFGLEYQDDISLLVGSLKEYEKAVDLLGDKTKYAGSMQREFENRSKTTANNLQLLKNTLAEVGMNIGSVLLPPLNSLTKSLRTVSSTVANIAERFPVATKVIMGTTAALISAKVGAIALGYAWTFVKGGALALMTVWHSMSAAIALVKTGFVGMNATAAITAIRFKAISFSGIKSAILSIAHTAIPALLVGLKSVTAIIAANPIGAIAVGLTTVATLIITNWSKVQVFFQHIWQPIKEAWSKFADWVGGFWEKISSPFKAI